MPSLILDLTAENPDNFIPAEEHSLAGGQSVIVPNNGFFYDKDLRVVNSNTGQPLNRGSDYVLSEPIRTVHKMPYQAYLLVRIINPSVTNALIDYRAVGDFYSLTTDAISNIRGFVNGDQVDWDQLVNVPTEFYPQPHMHHARELSYGGLIEVIAYLAEVVNFNNGSALESMYRYINERTSNIEFYGNLVDLSWGAVRDNITGFTINWGTMTPDTSAAAQAAGGARWECNFKKHFNASLSGPTILPCGSFGKFGPFELESKDEEGFIHVVKYDPDHPSTAMVDMKYLAIGISSVSTAISNTPVSQL